MLEMLDTAVYFWTKCNNRPIKTFANLVEEPRSHRSSKSPWTKSARLGWALAVTKPFASNLRVSGRDMVHRVRVDFHLSNKRSFQLQSSA